MVRENLERVRERIAAAARSVGRDPAGVRLIGVTKGIPVEQIREAISCGVDEIGESRVQEAQEKQLALGTVPPGDCPQITWHLVGHLQRNKVKFAVELFHVIHSVDSIDLIEALDRQVTLRQACPERSRRAQGERTLRAPFKTSGHSRESGNLRGKPDPRFREDDILKRTLKVLVQVNVSGGATRHGCPPEEVARLAERISKTSCLKLTGLMTLAPFSENPEDSRLVFRKLRQLRDELPYLSLHLSMGMSQDFETAIQEGATLVRVGTAIFGERTNGQKVNK